MMKIALMLLLMGCAGACWGRSIIVDPYFPYYTDRSEESIVEEIKANGYDDVRLTCNSESKISPALVNAFVAAKFKVWMMTFGNGVYGGADLPKGWEAWKVKQRKDVDANGFTYFCLNNPGYREWKKKQLTSALNAHPFHGLDIAESFWPDYGGPERDMYACLCDTCAAAFKKMHPDVSGIPDFEDANSPHYWKTDKMLYEKWVGFRVASAVDFLNDLVNGPGGIREKCPNVKVATWSLGLDTPGQIEKLREWQGLDAAAIVRRVKPDVHVIQTHWPDWIKGSLPGNYPLKYKPVADSVREVSPKTVLMLQTDIGSQQQNRRSREWVAQAEKAGKEIGCQGTFHYEYFLGDYIYTEPPKVVNASYEPGCVKLIFQKRLDSASAASLANYSISPGKIDFARVDGNIVRLSVSATGEHPTVTISGISDDESRRFFHDKPQCTMAEDQVVTVGDAPARD